ncbi:MAG: RNA polymerase sigma factor [Myxococcota bacterium]|jgi:RNA polymerase sigma-70 factor (ECF subfamily)|nr:RNA polymerase sigma factor [Myxococcota bacterium]
MPANLQLLKPEHSATWTEADIKKLAASNARGAMEAVIQKYRDPLYFHARYIVKDHQEAYDVVQEVFIKAMREARLFDDEFKIKAWLFRVTSNLCFNQVRNRKRRGAILDSMVKPEAFGADQMDTVFAGEQREEMTAALEQLSDDHRQILVLRYYDDLSYAEIAEVLQVKLGTVMSRLSRARMRLSTVMDESELVN